MESDTTSGHHMDVCICAHIRYEDSPFVGWSCVWGDVWAYAATDGSSAAPVRVFFGTLAAGSLALLRAQDDADPVLLDSALDERAVRQQALRHAAAWAVEIERDARL